MAKYTQYEKDGSQLWHVKGYLGVDPTTGRQKQFNRKGFKTKKEARQQYDRAKMKFEKGEYDKQLKKRTYQDTYDEWYELEYRQGAKESTQVKTKQTFDNHILPKIGHKFIDKITSNDIQKLLNEWHKQFSTHKQIFNYMCMVFDYAKRKHYIKSNPKDEVKVPALEVEYKTGKSEKEFYSRSELQQFLALCEDMETLKWLAFFRLLAFSGIRRGEALALTWNDINLTTGDLSITKTLTLGEENELIIQPPKSKAGTRELGLDPTTLQILKQWKHEQAQKLIGFGFNAMKKNQLMFCKYKDNSHLDLSAPRNAYMKIVKDSAVETINIHGFRHTHCTLLFEAGVSIKDVQKRLGHADIQTTMNVYAHVTKDSENKSAELFANYVNF